MNHFLRLRHVSFLALALCVALTACGSPPESPAADATPTEPVVDRPAEPAGTASITGSVRYEGQVPTLRPINMQADPACAAKHDGPVLPEVLVLGEENELANVFVRVRSGLPNQKWAPPSEPVVMDQDGCRYIPRVHGVMVGQTFRILNSDGILHNVNAAPKRNRTFNIGMPAARTEAEHVFTEPEEEKFEIRCDVHPWMASYVSVLEHPFFDTTERDGGFSITGLPAGTYEIEAWHERLGTQTASVTVGDDETETVEFVFKR